MCSTKKVGYTIYMPRAKTKTQSIFGGRLEALRKSRNLTQAELADEVGLSRGTIAYYEATAQNPTVETVQALAEYFGVSVLDLIEPPARSKKPGRISRIEQQIERIKKLPPGKQKLASELIEAFLQNA